jgi:hypothetical protein|tara:strand:- start:587 stop:739 length:153 start_codon:yes stop_codon:yes gene_type:complete
MMHSGVMLSHVTNEVFFTMLIGKKELDAPGWGHPRAIIVKKIINTGDLPP